MSPEALTSPFLSANHALGVGESCASLILPGRGNKVGVRWKAELKQRPQSGSKQPQWHQSRIRIHTPAAWLAEEQGGDKHSQITHTSSPSTHTSCNFNIKLYISNSSTARVQNSCFVIYVKSVKQLSAQLVSVKRISRGMLACLAVNTGINECIPVGPTQICLKLSTTEKPLHIYLSRALQTIKWPRGGIERIITINRQRQSARDQTPFFKIMVILEFSLHLS